ncbi:MAG TPA: tRNA (adenosine(37)-N6)-threonylcarbamoyltransferase complex dimerization subunit type 1 TsaB [Rhizomicrobium sp.]|jgi:tRNA threonylcarbamoyladenosine biosynthesis protein TsaB|nr:tRNA (adenosine(37)-N6)-threonylcarbamoyltransferase complex dimerization subunit type 1 TsaB [Rhizomicrobium sp.]
MKILAVDTALGACSAALLEDEVVLAHRFAAMERGHAEALAPMVEEVMAGHAFESLHRLAVTTGPGTFTGQRVGLAFMRGLKVALSLPLAGVTTLAAMAEQAKAQCGTARAIALHDARRDEVYVEIDGVPAVMRFDDAIERLRALGGARPIALAGTAANRACEALANGFVLSDVRQPDALWVARLATKSQVSDAPPRPLYLRAPDAKLPAGKHAIRSATRDDIAAMARLHAACFTSSWSEEALRDLMESPGIIALVSPAGFVLARVAADEAEILSIGVEPAARRGGLGAALATHAAALASAHGARTMFLEVSTANDAAQALYRGLGFDEAGRRKAYYGASEDAFILRANLPFRPLGNRKTSTKVDAQPPGNDRDAD